MVFRVHLKWSYHLVLWFIYVLVNNKSVLYVTYWLDWLNPLRSGQRVGLPLQLSDKKLLPFPGLAVVLVSVTIFIHLMGGWPRELRMRLSLYSGIVGMFPPSFRPEYTPTPRWSTSEKIGTAHEIPGRSHFHRGICTYMSTIFRKSYSLSNFNTMKF